MDALSRERLATIERVGSGPRRRLSGLLVVTEIALALMLLAGAGLFVRSFVNQQRVDFGFDVDRLVVAGLRLPESRFEHGAARFRFLDDLSTRLLRLPGVQAVAPAGSVPPEPGYFLAFGRMELDAVSGTQDTSELFIASNPVAPDYFDALGIPLLEGRPSHGRTSPPRTRWPSWTLRPPEACGPADPPSGNAFGRRTTTPGSPWSAWSVKPAK